MTLKRTYLDNNTTSSGSDFCGFNHTFNRQCSHNKTCNDGVTKSLIGEIKLGQLKLHPNAEGIKQNRHIIQRYLHASLENK